MPEKSQTIHVNGYEASVLISIAYGTLEKLEWQVKYAGENLLIASTPGDWHYTGEEFTIRSIDNEVTVTSKMVQGQVFDMGGKNKKHIKAFTDAFETVRISSAETQILEWQQKVEALKEETILLAEDEIKQAEEVNKIMNLSSGNMYFTYGIIAMNVLVYILMVVSGVDFMSPTGQDIVNWGGSFAPSVHSGEWWRVITCVFVHIGIIHLLFNMYALFTIGVYLEPMLRKPKFIIAYLCTGVFASLLSLWWHDTPVASAGASGAIFGMYGVFLALLSTSLIPKNVRKQLLQSIGIFVGYNLIFGLKSGIDNAAHIGGLLSGLVIGYVYYLDLRKREEYAQPGFKPALIVIITVLAAFAYLKNTAIDYKPGDSESFSKTLEHFGALEELALEAMQTTDTTSKEVYLDQLKKTALSDWVHCVNLFEEAEKLKLDPKLHALRIDMLQYSNHRLQQTLLYIKATEEESHKYAAGIDSIQREIDLIIEKIQKGNSTQAD